MVHCLIKEEFCNDKHKDSGASTYNIAVEKYKFRRVTAKCTRHLWQRSIMHI